ncbi:hypothetical protein PIB30_017935 [Stylosanthes scabra]|uniref:Uncharacterized protein n=1 Tax=Stylosanthes scabra TaxID=79078 RepID=A0ABU6R833_9FABA|nr:hypothetical protein [Stylosanthes scabra]
MHSGTTEPDVFGKSSFVSRFGLKFSSYAHGIQKKDCGKDNPEQGKHNEIRCNKSGTRNATNNAICCSS